MTFPLMILTIGVGLTLLVALLMLALILRHRKKLQEISDQLAEGAVDDGKTLKRVVQEENAATRLHVSHAVDGVRHDTENIKIRVTEFIAQQTHSANEFRGQLRHINHDCNGSSECSISSGHNCMRSSRRYISLNNRGESKYEDAREDFCTCHDGKYSMGARHDYGARARGSDFGYDHRATACRDTRSTERYVRHSCAHIHAESQSANRRDGVQQWKHVMAWGLFVSGGRSHS